MENFIPFGAQYYRAPTPDRTDWERDLKNFAAQGFNTIKIWAQWRWNNPSEEAYDFSDLDVLMDLAQENKLKVVINTIFDVAPAWFYQKYPESLMITADGPFSLRLPLTGKLAARLAPVTTTKRELRHAKAFWLKRSSILRTTPRYMYGICGMSLN